MVPGTDLPPRIGSGCRPTATLQHPHPPAAHTRLQDRPCTTPAATWWCWIGGHRRGDVSYFRVQAPVIVVELDHHCRPMARARPAPPRTGATAGRPACG
ncbi:DUF3500 domain-containing protein [Streptomyces sp. NPDC002144]